MHGHSVEDISAAPVLLNIELTWLLPRLVLEREEDDLGTNSGLDTLDGSCLVLRRWDSLAVGVTGGWPAGFHYIHILSWANLAQVVDLSLDEAASVFSRGISVEESVQVGTDNIYNVTPC